MDAERLSPADLDAVWEAACAQWPHSSSVPLRTLVEMAAEARISLRRLDAGSGNGRLSDSTLKAELMRCGLSPKNARANARAARPATKGKRPRRES